MNRQKIKLFLYFIIGMLSAFLIMYLIDHYEIIRKNPDKETAAIEAHAENSGSFQQNKSQIPGNNAPQTTKNSGIDALTEENHVIDYVKAHKALPDYYMTKSEARKGGWVASEGNLCEVLPGRAIGGDHFSNREKRLPQGEKYFEADVNYQCGRRNADRIVFTQKGDVWLTKNHYKSFEKR
ncbi:ribonuclease domain-containing protein [Chryseobacterium sp. MFBS3-17]|uniref:ribonuclease domain-containing protein n=1 Tax=Chryseobacterium sp. MFBS3-17 TaxID=2886689 RepID=UPI001D0EA9C5|nr:ribonuclease domain-containing protein [Chryseobacterium sp. MFBS3-17]MCC2590873.1 ribonuclease N [Chryseobacterium sp. MFBS3-17]